jgi:hypothetical protein
MLLLTGPQTHMRCYLTGQYRIKLTEPAREYTRKQTLSLAREYSCVNTLIGSIEILS